MVIQTVGSILMGIGLTLLLQGKVGEWLARLQMHRRWQSVRRHSRKRAHEEAVQALRDLIGMVDQMDLPPSRGGGVLPIDKGLILRRARKAAGL